MYEDFFGFSRRPFSLTPDPDFLFWTAQHRRAFDLVRFALVRQAPVSLITGEVGAGKTTLIRELLREVSQDLEVALLSNVVGDSGDLLRWILTAFGQEAAPSSRAEALREVEAFLRGVWEQGRRSVLVIDEAQNVSDIGIETLRLLTNLNVGKKALLSLILAGQPQLRDRLAAPRFGAFRQRLGASCHLGPMSLDETVGYVRKRIEIAEGDPDLFEDGAIAAVHRRAKGLPRITNLLCDVCLVSAFGEDRRRIGEAYAEAVLAESLATAGLGGLAAEAAEVAEPAMQSIAEERRAHVGWMSASAPAAPFGFDAAASIPRPRAASHASLRLVSGGSGQEASDEALLRLDGPAPSSLVPEAPPHEACPQAVAIQADRGGQVMRRVLGSAVGIAVAAGVAGVALVLPATETDGGPVTAPLAEVGPDVPSEGPRALAAAGPVEAAGAVVAGPGEAVLAAPDPQGAERLFQAAVGDASADTATASVDYARAAARGHARAAYYLAQMYETGDGVPFAPDTAWTWYGVASEDIAGAAERLDALAAFSRPEVGFAAPRFGMRDGGVVELVWEGRGSFVVELAALPDDAPEAVHQTPLTAARLLAPPDVAWWRVRAVGSEPSEWRPIRNGPDAVAAVPG